MTGEETETAAGRGPSATWRSGTMVAGLLIGLLFVVSAVSSAGIDLRPQRYGDLAGLAEAERADYAKLEARLNRMAAEVAELTDQVEDDRVSQLRREVEVLRDPAGLAPREGAGITVVLQDAPEEYFIEVAGMSDEERPAGIRGLNDLIVHQQDIQSVVNAMWSAGASAVTIAGQRVVSTTGIRCHGSVVQLQGVPYPQPFEIRAIGDPETLRSAVESDDRMVTYRHPVYQLGWELVEEDHIEAPAFTGLVEHQYASPLT
jgi:uncharacterized protein YlxW (UPF0749 family)